MNILPELLGLIKEYTIGYRTIEETKLIRTKNDTYDIKKEVWKGDQRFQTGTYKSWNNGVVCSEISYVYSILYNVKSWYIDGNLETEYNYNTGIDKVWYLNGNIRGSYNRDKNRLLHGIQRQWHKNGNLYKEFNYKHGIIDGILRIWNEDGRIELEELYKDGKQHGISTYYFYNKFNTLILRIEEYCEGKLINRKECSISNYLENRDEYFTGIAGPNQGVHDRVQNN